MSNIKHYMVTPEEKNCTYQIECWTNTLTNGKNVILHVTTIFYDGEFSMELTEQEKNDILEKDIINFDEYSGVSCDNLTSSSDLYTEIKNNEQYNNEETREINRLLFCSQDNSDDYNSDDCDFDDCEFDEDILQENDWIMRDTSYSFQCSCEVEPLGEDINDNEE